MQTKTVGSLPESVQKRLEAFTKSLESILQKNLVALLVFGSAIRGGYDEQRSDVDVLIVLEDDSRKALTSISEPLRQARFSARIEAVILTEREIPRAADVFPLFYDDIRQQHVLLSGRDPFVGLHISDQHRRIRIEQELRELQIRLRRAVTDSAHTDELLSGLIYRKLRQLRAPLHALLRLQGFATKDSLEDVLTTAATLYRLDLGALRDIRRSTDAAYNSLTQLLHAAIEDVDRRDEEGKV